MTTEPPAPDVDDEGRQEFASFLIQHAGGQSHDELTAALAELVRAVRETGKAGSLTYTVKIKPDGRRNLEEVVAVTDDVKANLPGHDRPVSIFFVTSDYRLTQDHPNQLSAFDVHRETS